VVGNQIWPFRTASDTSNVSRTLPSHESLRNLHVSLLRHSIRQLFWRRCFSINYPRFQASAAMWMRSALFWYVTQRRVVILYLHFGTPIGPAFKEPLKVGPLCVPKCPQSITTRRCVTYQKNADLISKVFVFWNFVSFRNPPPYIQLPFTGPYPH
jgi:hypothetical protein